MASDRLAFSGVRVVDFTQGVAGPHATMLLALNGADVVKIEPPEGDWGRGLGDIKGDHCAHSIAFNRAKRSIALDLKHPKGVEAARRLAAKADVVVESFRPGVLDRFGLGHAQLSKDNPKLVYASVTGFGQTGPYNHRPTVDSLIQGFSGMMAMNKTADGQPHRMGMIAVDVMTGLYTYNAISGGIVRQIRFGEGSRLDCSLMASAAAFQTAKIMEFVFSNGAPPPLYVPGGMFKTADGHISIGAMRVKHFQALVEAVGRADMVDDPRFASHELRIKNAAAINQALNAEFPKKTSAEWLKILHAADVYAERVNTYKDYLEHPHVAAVGAVDWIEVDGVGRMPVTNMPGLPPTREDPRAQSVPHLGEQTEAILAEAGYGAADIRAMIDGKAARAWRPAAAKAAE